MSFTTYNPDGSSPVYPYQGTDSSTLTGAGPSVPPQFLFPRGSVSGVVDKYIVLASDSALTNSITIPISLYWNNENTSSGVQLYDSVGGLFSPDQGISLPNWFWGGPPQDGSALSQWMLVNWLFGNVEAGNNNQPVTPSDSAPDLFPDYPGIKAVVIGINALPVPQEFIPPDYIGQYWQYNLFAGGWLEMPSYYWAYGLQLQFFSIVGGVVTIDTSDFFYPGARELIVHAAASTGIASSGGDNSFAPYIAFQGFPNGSGFGPVNPTVAYPFPIFPSSPGWTYWLQANPLPRRIVDAGRDPAVQALRPVNAFDKTFPDSLYGYPPPNDFSLTANATIKDLAAGGDYLLYTFSPYSDLPVSDWRYLDGPGPFGTWCSVTLGGYAAPITRFNTAGGRTFYIG